MSPKSEQKHVVIFGLFIEKVDNVYFQKLLYVSSN